MLLSTLSLVFSAACKWIDRIQKSMYSRVDSSLPSAPFDRKSRSYLFLHLPQDFIIMKISNVPDDGFFLPCKDFWG